MGRSLMAAQQTSAEHVRIRREFEAVVNMSADEIAAFLETDGSRKVGFTRPGEAESVGRQSGRRIIDILGTPDAALDDGDYAHMRKVVGFVRRHRPGRPLRDPWSSRWRLALMNWGHDPMKDDLPLI
jgi:hypothetical protein